MVADHKPAVRSNVMMERTGFCPTNISCLASLDAQDTYPQSVLSGDRNLAVVGRAIAPGMLVLDTNSPTPLRWTRAIHGSCGNIGLADGSVEMLNQKRLAAAVLDQGMATNRLVLP